MKKHPILSSLGIATLASFSFWLLKKDLVLSLIVAFVIFLTSWFIFILIGKEEDEVSKYDATSNLIRNILEVSAFLLVGITAYQSTWFDNFFYQKEVQINGIVLERLLNKNLLVMEPIHFKFTFIDLEGKEKDLKISVVSEKGELQKKIKIHRDYDEATVTILSDKYGFYKHINKDSIISIPNLGKPIPFNYHLVFDPSLKLLSDGRKDIAEN